MNKKTTSNKSVTTVKGEIMVTKEMVITSLSKCNFSVAKTRKGTDYRIYDINGCDGFWDLWRNNKDTLKGFGFVVFKAGSGFFVRDFSGFDYDCSKKASKARSVANLEVAREVKAQNDEARKALKEQEAPKVVKVAKGKSNKPKALSTSEALELAKAIELVQKYGFSVK